MVYFKCAAVAIALSMCPLGALAAGTSKQDLFEDFVGRIPDDLVRDDVERFYNEKNYDMMEETLFSYVNEYVENNSDGENKKTKEDKRNKVMDMVFNFLDEKRGNEKALEDSKDGKVQLMQILNTIPDEDVKSQSLELLHEKKFGLLEESIFQYLDKYISTLPADERKTMESNKFEIKGMIDDAIFESSEGSKSVVIPESIKTKLLLAIGDIPGNDEEDKAFKEELLDFVDEGKLEDIEDDVFQFFDEFDIVKEEFVRVFATS